MAKNTNGQFIGNLCVGEDAPHGEACVNEIHLRGWNVYCECACHIKAAAASVNSAIPFNCADRDTFNTIYGGGASQFPTW